MLFFHNAPKQVIEIVQITNIFGHFFLRKYENCENVFVNASGPGFVLFRIIAIDMRHIYCVS